jgi:hypothetical protein
MDLFGNPAGFLPVKGWLPTKSWLASLPKARIFDKIHVCCCLKIIVVPKPG